MTEITIEVPHNLLFASRAMLDAAGKPYHFVSEGHAAIADLRLVVDGVKTNFVLRVHNDGTWSALDNHTVPGT